MPGFQYKGRNQAGELVSGMLEAASKDGVASQLQGRGIIPVAINEVVKREPVNITLIKPKVTLDDLSMFSRQMYSLTKAGVVLNSAMRGLSESSKNPRLSEVLTEVTNNLNAGVNLATAMSRHPDVFDDFYVSIVRVGENSGRLDQCFLQMSQYLDLEKETRRRVGSALRYPMFVLVAIAVALVVLNIWVIPVFAGLFEKFGAELPWATKILIGTSAFFVNYWPQLIVLTIAAVFGLRYYINTPAGRLRWDRYKLRLPAVGGILERSMLARFGRSFALMLRSGVSLIQALELCAKAVDNAYLAVKIREMRVGVQHGESLLRISMQSGMFTPLVLQMIQVGEDTGQVDELLEEVAKFYEQEVDYDLKNLSSLIEPILIAAIAGLVMILALGIFLPMWDMMNVVQR